ncbi:MAG: SDR family NAD(P)-dependent oxidoreductase [Janibacter sp.]|nr:SDR family NAD(P)-dependent oxidoreductase [Janibacter sp.]
MRASTPPRSPKGAVVTGAGRGLGRQIATLLVERGYTVLVTDVDEPAAKEAAAALGERAEALVVDVRDEAAVLAARDRHHLGPVAPRRSRGGRSAPAARQQRLHEDPLDVVGGLGDVARAT